MFINDLQQIDKNATSGLRIPLGKSVHQIASIFASEQATEEHGKQVFINTLAVIAVHKCLKLFKINSYLESGECWNKMKRAMDSVADLLVEDWGRLECFPILPEQKQIDISPDFLDSRGGCVAVKFHENFNYVEMSGFLKFDEPIKSKLEETFTLCIQELEPFENIFYDIKPCKASGICQGDDWKTFEELGRRRLVFAGPSNQLVFAEPSNKNQHLPLKGKTIDLRENKNDENEDCQIILGAAVDAVSEDKRTILFEIYNLLPERKIPKDLTITVLSDQGVVGDLEQKPIGGNYRFEMKFKQLPLKTIFTIIFSHNNVQISNRFIVEL